MIKKPLTGLILFTLWMNACTAQPKDKTMKPVAETTPSQPIICGAERMSEYLPLIQGKNIALLINQTARVGRTHLVDTLLSHHISIKKIFAPEHGFRGGADAGEHVMDSVDAKTKIPVISLYGNKKKPSAEDLQGIDVVIYDIQDVGARFYTFISTLHYLMEACAENSKELLVLDRPNPNGWYVDGPVLKKKFQSFVGVDPVPVVHGLTVGEYARMVNGEKWLPDGKSCPLTVITCKNYDHKMRYSLPLKPSPNLPNDASIALYPALCFFEGTNISVGRGTDAPFQVIGSPKTKFEGAYEFKPLSKPGAKNPPFLDETCYGFDLRKEDPGKKKGFLFKYVLEMYRLYPEKSDFFLKNNFFEKLCGTDSIRKLIEEGKNEMRIKESYQTDLLIYKSKRKKYLLYQDFE